MKTATTEVCVRSAQTFLQRLNPSVRDRLLRRFILDASHMLDHYSKSEQFWAKGSLRPAMLNGRLEGPIEKSDSELKIAAVQVMQSWEWSLMEAMVRACNPAGCQVLEIGYGLGIAAECFRHYGVCKHTIIEINPAIATMAQTWARNNQGYDVDIICRDWRDLSESLSKFDVIMFDAYPLTEEQARTNVDEDIVLAEEFFPVAARLLRNGGRFTFYSNQIDTVTHRLQRRLLEHFARFTVSLSKNLRPPELCDYWVADSMCVIVAEKP